MSNVKSCDCCTAQKAADQQSLQDMSERLYRREDSNIKQLRVPSTLLHLSCGASCIQRC